MVHMLVKTGNKFLQKYTVQVSNAAPRRSKKVKHPAEKVSCDRQTEETNFEKIYRKSAK